jgi:hypothetical protein
MERMISLHKKKKSHKIFQCKHLGERLISNNSTMTTKDNTNEEKKKVYLENTKYAVELRNVKIYFILAKMTPDSYYISREEVRIFPQIALLSRIKSSIISQNYAVRKTSDKSLIKNQEHI